MDHNNRFKQAESAAILGMAGNAVLAIIKWIIGVNANSKALIADAVHSASDISGSLAVFIGLRASRQPPDEDHPYGHGKAESIAAIIVAVLMVMIGFEVGKASFEALFEPLQAPKGIAIVAVVISIIVKEAMFRYNYNLGKRLNSDALIVNAYDHRSDVYSSIAALIGICAAIVGGWLGFDWLVYADPVAGFFVALLIIKMAWTLGRESIHNTLDHVLHEEDTQEFRNIVENIPEVKKIDVLHAREHGHYVIIDLKISVDPVITVEEGHRIGKKVKERLMKMGNVHNVFVHINPYNSEKIKIDDEIFIES
ncbi:cation-efflux pump [Bacillus canaveralius]|uniref:Cation-efflux pump n=1 Tax=Bacillus canaveralius TaxID=1403243 RepID=A0A2N5GH13_9BACI|nr:MULTISPECIES: cation diffusion facilitator family transporter [Bacillus]PLR80063.1 cation-efflux pump [Bacillus canaveralius]PLR83895.1 cation-efflux pump [Bacillus sp. V33-4]PLR89040.1 cation-efflux pump [Bacillus canaveralius]RSK47240.1 cation transporter [Bacillus canaveralius]